MPGTRTLLKGGMEPISPTQRRLLWSGCIVALLSSVALMVWYWPGALPQDSSSGVWTALAQGKGRFPGAGMDLGGHGVRPAVAPPLLGSMAGRMRILLSSGISHEAHGRRRGRPHLRVVVGAEGPARGGCSRRLLRAPRGAGARRCLLGE